MNSVNLIGRLTKDPESRDKGELKISGLRLAVPRRDRQAAPVYIDVTAFGPLAELAAEHLVQGQQIAVAGRLEYSEWQAKDKTRRSKHELIAEQIDFLQKSNGNGEAAAGGEEGEA